MESIFRANFLHLRLPDIRFLLHYHEKVKQPSATRQAAALLGYRVVAIDQTGRRRFSLIFSKTAEGLKNLVDPILLAFKAAWAHAIVISWLAFPPTFLASAPEGFTLYILYIGGVGVGVGVVFGLVLGLETGFVSSGFCG
jgi:hypothetical protein